MATGTAVDVVMPQMGVSVSEGTVTKWLKSVGEEVQADDPLLEISTDKVDTEVPSPGSGVLTEILVQEGQTVEVGTKLAVIGGDGAGAPERKREASPEPATAEAAAEAEAPSSAESPAPTAPPEPEAAAQSNGKTFVSPVVAKIASEHGVDPSQVQGTGRGGRVTKKDILSFIESGAQPAAAPAAPQPEAPVAPQPEAPTAPAPPPPQAAPAPAPPKAPPAPAPAPAAAQPGESFEPMSAMRRGIAEHMRRSLDTSAHVTSAIEVDMSKVVAIRAKLKK